MRHANVLAELRRRSKTPASTRARALSGGVFSSVPSHTSGFSRATTSKLCQIRPVCSSRMTDLAHPAPQTSGPRIPKQGPLFVMPSTSISGESIYTRERCDPHETLKSLFPQQLLSRPRPHTARQLFGSGEQWGFPAVSVILPYRTTLRDSQRSVRRKITQSFRIHCSSTAARY